MDINFGERIKFLRSQRGLTQTALANILGVTKTMISSYESGIRKPSYENLMGIALYFSVSMDWLFGNANHNEVFSLNLSRYTDAQRNLITDIAKIIEQNNSLNAAKASSLKLKVSEQDIEAAINSCDHCPFKKMRYRQITLPGFESSSELK